MVLKVFVDRISQPARAVVIFCKMNNIDFEEVTIDLFKGEHLSPDYQDINPLCQVPAISDGSFKLSESHAILRYLACAFPGVADHWYPAELCNRAKVDSILDWHHSSLRRGATTLIQYTALLSAFHRSPNQQLVDESEKTLNSALSNIESLWLKDDAKFLLGNSQPSIADLSLVCEIMELELLNEEHRERILSPYKKISEWIENVKTSTSPHFEEVHELLYKTKEKLHGDPNFYRPRSPSFA